MLASLVMKWNLFQGSVNHQKVQQSRIEGEKLDELYLQTQQKISLEVINNYFGVRAAFESVESARTQTRSARRAYELINKKYLEGQASLLEQIDARTSLTGAVANVIIARSDFFSRLADFECAMGTNGLENQ
jgi:outer membrane protein TolC